MADFFRKTDRGRREVRERSLQLSRSARNLLLILDSSKTLADWTAMVQGTTLADGVALLEAGLIEAMPGPGGVETRPAAFEPTEPMGIDAWLAAQPPRGVDLRAPDRISRPAALDGPVSAPSPLSPPHSATLQTPFPAPVPTPPRAPLEADLMNTRWPPLSTGQPAPQPPGPPQGQPTPPTLLASVPSAAGSPTGGLPPGLSPSRLPTLQPPYPTGRTVVPLAPGDPATGAPSDSDFSTFDSAAPLNSALGYTELYDSLNALLRETLGLFRGYRYTLRIERAQNVQELEAVAREFLAEVKRLRGDTMARMVARALGFGG